MVGLWLLYPRYILSVSNDRQMIDQGYSKDKLFRFYNCRLIEALGSISTIRSELDYFAIFPYVCALKTSKYL